MDMDMDMGMDMSMVMGMDINKRSDMDMNSARIRVMPVFMLICMWILPRLFQRKTLITWTWSDTLYKDIDTDADTDTDTGREEYRLADLINGHFSCGFSTLGYIIAAYLGEWKNYYSTYTILQIKIPIKHSTGNWFNTKS